MSRRAFLKKSVALGGSVLVSGAWLHPLDANAAWHNSDDILQGTIKRLFKDQQIVPSDKIDIKLPKTAGNDASVPITVTSSLENVESISILVEKNPTPLAAKFELSPDMGPYVSTRLKIAESSTVIVVMETGDGFYSSSEKVVVKIGGC